MGQQKTFFGVGRQMEKLSDPKIKLNNSKQTHDYIRSLFMNLKSELTLAIYVTKNNHLIRGYLIRGERNHTLIDVHKIFQKAIILRAKGIFLIHNHPSGDPFPSRDDISTTIQIKRMSNVMRIRFVDHIILGDDYYFSFFDNGKL